MHSFPPVLTRRKKLGREAHTRSEYVKKLHGIKLVLSAIYSNKCDVMIIVVHRAKLYNRKRYTEKVVMRKKWVFWTKPPHSYELVFEYRIKQHEQQKTKSKKEDVVPQGAVPPYLLDREGQSRAKVLSNMIKQKRKEKAVREMEGLGGQPLLPIPSSLPPVYPLFSHHPQWTLSHLRHETLVHQNWLWLHQPSISPRPPDPCHLYFSSLWFKWSTRF